MITIGARDSKLSRIQTGHVINELKKHGVTLNQPLYLKSKGDLNTSTPLHLLNEDGLFTSFLEQALLNHDVDLVVHSLKDLPTTPHPDLEITPVLPRQDPRDLLIIHKNNLSSKHETERFPQIKPGTRIATSSLRRQAQIKHVFPNTSIIDLRGNIDTRLKKLQHNWFDALVISQAGLKRYPVTINDDYAIIPLPLHQFPTAPGQGSLAVQYRKDDEQLKQVVQNLIHEQSKQAVELERHILKQLGSGCMIPVGITVYTEHDTHVLSYFHAHSSTNITKHLFFHSDFKQLTQLADTLLFKHAFALDDSSSSSTPSPSISESLRHLNLFVTRSDDDPILQSLLQYGIHVHSLPQYTYVPLPSPSQDKINEIQHSIQKSTWIVFTSKRGVWYYPRILYPFLIKKKIAVVGKTTALHAKKHGIPVHYLSKRKNATDLAKELLEIDPELTGVTHFTSTTPSPGLYDVFQDHNVPVYQYPVYQAVPLSYQLQPDISSYHDPWILVFSSEQARHLLETTNIPDHARWIAIGPKTAATLKQHQIHHVFVPSPPTPTGIVEVLQHESKN